MSLTRELLEELNLDEDVAGRILAAHQEALDASTAESARIQSEFDTYRREVDARQTAAERQRAICEALRRAGANEQAIPLLAMAVSTNDDDWEGALLHDEAAALAPVQAQYAGFFAHPVPLPTDPIAPPLDGGRLTAEDVRGMSPQEINDNWSVICAALAHRS